jgi:hypothetical protein
MCKSGSLIFEGSEVVVDDRMLQGNISLLSSPESLQFWRVPILLKVRHETVTVRLNA